MKSLLRKFNITPAFLLFTFLFAYLSSIKNRIRAGHQVDGYLFTPESALVSIPEVILIVLLVGSIFLSYTNKRKNELSILKIAFLFLLALGTFILTMNAFAIAISLVFDTMDRNFSANQILNSNLEHLVDFCIYGGFYLAFFLFQRDKKHREKIENFNQSLAATQIQQLRQQLDPHFLFNNLNILDQLIRENPEKASSFLLDFSDLFRYLLENGQKQLVSVSDELEFALKYFALIKYKYGDAYQLDFNLPERVSGDIPALSLQLLIENAVQHNLGTETDPVIISISLINGIQVKNTLKPKVFKKKTGGRSLQNLKIQFEMLGKKNLDIRQSEACYEITLPILNESIA